MEFTEGTILNEEIGTVICTNCYAIMSRSCYKIKCPICNNNFDAVIVDELIANTIAELNKKGYETKTCCSGHVYGKDGYIAFKDDSLLSNINKFCKNEFTFYNFEKEFKEDINVIRWIFVNRNMGYLEKLDEIIKINKILYLWAEQLPIK